MISRARLSSFAATFALALAVTAPCRADEASQAALAESLFREGRALVTAGKLAEACEKFAESRRLDPAPGTLLNLARCYEDVGRTASAWATYKELDARATALDQKARAEFARKRASELEPTLPAVVVRVAPAHRLPDLAVTYDGVAVGSAAWDTRVPVDPGRHRVVAQAKGFVPWTREVDVAASATVVVEVGPLASAMATETSPPPSEGRGLRTTGLVLGGLGAATTVTGLVFGLLAKNENDGARREACDPRGCTSEGLARIGRADDLATVSTVLTIGGAVVAAAGVTLWLVAPRTSVAVHAGKVSLGGTF